MPNAYLPAPDAPACTLRLLHDEVADMLHTPSITICTVDETRPAQLILMHVCYALWEWETCTLTTHITPHLNRETPIQMQEQRGDMPLVLTAVCF